MKINWQKPIVKIFFWLLVEAIFSLIGIDDLADRARVPTNAKSHGSIRTFSCIMINTTT